MAAAAAAQEELNLRAVRRRLCDLYAAQWLASNSKFSGSNTEAGNVADLLQDGLSVTGPSSVQHRLKSCPAVSLAAAGHSGFGSDDCCCSASAGPEGSHRSLF